MGRKDYKYGELRKLGVCIRCKGKNPTPEKPFCPRCDDFTRAKRKNDREWYKEQGICTLCHKSKAAPGKTLCFDCAEESRIRNETTRYKWTEEETEHYKNLGKKAAQRRKAERLEQGLCVRCGKHKLAKNSKSQCEWCLAKNRLRNRQARARKLDSAGILTQAEKIERGLCMWCGTPVEDKERKFCLACRERCSERSKKADKTNWLKWNRSQNDLVFNKKVKGE